jgi:predicted transcriptional regulator of viral defense system
MLKTREILMYELRSYASPKSKITTMIKKGQIIQIVRGVFATSPEDPRLPAASLIYNPSYISFETALAYHQMIPERVHQVKSAGFRLKKEKHFDTPFGRYSFLYIPESVFPWALQPAQDQGHGFRLATKEKALLDTLYKIRGIKSMKVLESLLFDDLRLEKDIVLKLDWATIQNLVPLYSSTTLQTLVKWRERNEQ